MTAPAGAAPNTVAQGKSNKKPQEFDAVVVPVPMNTPPKTETQAAVRIINEAQHAQQLGQFDKAITLYDMAEKLWDARAIDGMIPMQRSACYLSLKKYAEAEKDLATFKRVKFTPMPVARIAKEPLLESAAGYCMASRLDCLIMLGRWNEALQEIPSLVQLKVPIPADQYRGELLWLSGDLAKAIPALEASVKAEPTNEARRQMLELARYALQHPEEAPKITEQLTIGIKERTAKDIEAISQAVNGRNN